MHKLKRHQDNCQARYQVCVHIPTIGFSTAKSDLIYFNGATIVEVDHDNKRLLYVEDDLLEQDGTPLLLAYPIAWGVPESGTPPI